MSEPKPFASLSSSLLARKGHAKPAMRPQAFHISGDLTRLASHGEDDLGWNDMGMDAIGAATEAVVELRPAVEPVPIHGVEVPQAAVSPVAVQQAKLTEEFAPMAALPEPALPLARAAAGAKAKAAFTLRLDTDRHLRLRLVCALQHRSAQQVVTHALDDFLARQPGIDAALAKPAR